MEWSQVAIGLNVWEGGCTRDTPYPTLRAWNCYLSVQPSFHPYSGKAVTPWTVPCFVCMFKYTSNLHEVCNQSTAFLMIGTGEMGFRKKAL